MSADAKLQEYERLRLGLLPVRNVTIRHTAHPIGRQALTLELIKDEQVVSLSFSGLQQLRLADIHPGSRCLLKILSVEQDQWEGVRYRVFNVEQDLTLAFYCSDFDVSI